MTLLAWEIKKRLGFGAGRQIAAWADRSPGHVSKVINRVRRDVVVEEEIARRLKMSVVDVFGTVDSITVNGKGK